MSATEISIEKSPSNELLSVLTDNKGDSVVRPFISLSARGFRQAPFSTENTFNAHGALREVVTEFKNDERVVQDKEKLADRLKTLLHLLPAGVVVIDGRGKVQQCNAAATDLLGEPLEGEQWFNIIKRCFSPRHDDGHEVSLKDGRRVSIAIRSLDNEPGQLILLTDLTETRELQSKLSRHERLSSMGRMVASLAHQVRTPLSAAMLYAGHLCEDDIEDDLRKKCATKLMSRLVHLEQQVRDMLIFVKGDTPLAERLCVGELMHDLRLAADAAVLANGVSVQWCCETDATEILCNREALVGALMNLINNSIEAAKAPLSLTVSAALVDGGMIRLMVEDNGPGFSPKEKHRVTEAFYTTKAHGTGLGLAVVQAVAKAHRGRFDIAPVVNGTRATLDLPVV
jgi:two-component system sensor histidine kinase FlrB